MNNYAIVLKLKDSSTKNINSNLEIKNILDTYYQDIVCMILNIPKVTSMEFSSLPELTEIIIEDDIFIEAYAFLKCPKLEQITFRNNCKATIHTTAFLECDELKCIIGNPMNIKVGNFYQVNN